MTWAALMLTGETAVFVLAGFFGFRSQGYTLAEAGAAAILAMFALFSLLHQISCLSGFPLIGWGLEVGALAGLFYYSWQRRLGPRLKAAPKALLDLLGGEVFSAGILAVTWGAMLAVIVLGWLGLAGGGSHPWAAGMAGALTDGPLSATIGAPLTPLNSQALFHHSGRFGLSPGACGFGLLAHLAVGLSTYALARRYAWPPMALTVTLLVVSMPRLVGLAIWPTAELIATAAVAVALVQLYRFVEQHRGVDLALFLLSAAFSIDAHPMSLGLALVLVLLLLVVMVRRHGWILWGELLSGRRLWAALLLLPVLALGQVPVFALNLARGYPLFGGPVPFETHGLVGAAVNLLRYLLLSIDPTEAVRLAILWLSGLDLFNWVARIDAIVVLPLADRFGGAAAFTPIFTGGGDLGFGPLVPLLVLPAIVHAFLRGPRRLKAVSVAWAGYLYLCALVLAWQPGSIGVLTPLFAANGFVVAFSLPPYRLRRRGMRLLQALSIPLLGIAFYLAL
jgi:hypothetical protein